MPEKATNIVLVHATVSVPCRGAHKCVIHIPSFLARTVLFLLLSKPQRQELPAYLKSRKSWDQHGDTEGKAENYPHLHAMKSCNSTVPFFFLLACCTASKNPFHCTLLSSRLGEQRHTALHTNFSLMLSGDRTLEAHGVRALVATRHRHQTQHRDTSAQGWHL